MKIWLSQLDEDVACVCFTWCGLFGEEQRDKLIDFGVPRHCVAYDQFKGKEGDGECGVSWNRQIYNDNFTEADLK